MGTLDTDGLHNIYIEDCTFNNFGYGITINCGDGCRAVIRHNTFNDSLIGTHGQGSGPQFGCRHVEIYNNNFNYDGKVPMGSIWGCRGGTFVFYNNYVDPKHAATGYTTFSFCVDAITRAGELSCPYTYPIARQPGQGWNGATPAYADYNAWHAANPGWTPGNPTNGSYAWDQIGTTSDGAGNCQIRSIYGVIPERKLPCIFRTLDRAQAVTSAMAPLGAHQACKHKTLFCKIGTTI